MNKRLLIALVLIGILIAALIWYETDDESGVGDSMETENMMIDDNDPSDDDDDMIEDGMKDEEVANSASSPQAMEEENAATETDASYSDYEPSVLANGEMKVLFFYAAWCPICRAAEADVQAWYGAELPSINMYKVNYDTETALKSRFGVTYQHTFVLVDGEGNAVTTVQGPSDEQLRRMIGA